MYEIDEKDRVIELLDLPKLDPNTPEPKISAGEYRLVLSYGPNPFLGDDSDSAPLPPVHLDFYRPRAHYFGPPNDEALQGHPLFARGLRWYGVYEVQDSSWIRLLERRNRGHDKHRPESYAALRHFAFTFHDSTFECIAHGYRVLESPPASAAR